MTIRNISRQFILIGIFLWLTGGLFPVAVMAQEPPPAEAPPPFDPRFGVADSFMQTEAATTAGVGWSRVFFRWDVVQPGGPSDWKPANVSDDFLHAELAAGREVVAVLIGTPAWATDSQVSTAVPPTAYWGDFVFKIASQYKGRIKHWVIWNQPDINDPASPSRTWNGSEEDYYYLLKEAYLKIKAVDPEMQVHLAGLTYTWDRDRGQPQYLTRLLDIITADPQAPNENYFFDAVSYHIYYDPKQILDSLTHVRTILDSHSLGHKPIWLNETNAPPSEDILEPLASPSPVSVTLEEQSAFVIQAFALALAGGAERVAFYKLYNENPHPESVAPLGLLRGDGSPRPAYNAFRVVTTHFSGVQQTDWQQVDNIYMVTLNRGTQSTTVLWNSSPTPVTFSLNAIAPEALLVDDQGNEQPLIANNGLYTIQLPGAVCSHSACFIGGSPRLVIESGAASQRGALQPEQPLPTATPLLLPTDAPIPTPTPPLAPPTLTPTPVISSSLPSTEENNSASQISALPAPSDSPPTGALPDPGLGQADNSPPSGSAALPAPTTVPPLSFSSLLKPARILWLFLIGLMVFTISYGLQVVIWYRLRR